MKNLLYSLLLLYSVNSFKINSYLNSKILTKEILSKDILNPVIEKNNTKTHFWYVIGVKNEFVPNQLYKKTIWNKDYVVWQDDNNSYYAMDNHCSHRGASLADGNLNQNNVVCPYHGYEFNCIGDLVIVPGLNYTQNKKCHNIKNYQIEEKNGWIYLNKNASLIEDKVPIFNEPESFNINCTANFLNLPFNSYARLISENSLDVMHIVYVHTFGNAQVPSPIYENPPKIQKDYPLHLKTEYIYVAGNQSIAKNIFNSSYLNVDVEFILPNTQIVRIKFDTYISTIITSVLPINNTHSHIYMKTYRSYWYIPNAATFFEEIYNYIFGKFTEKIMMDTILQDKKVVENIDLNNMDGLYNMKYDKPGNVFRHLYKKYIHNADYSNFK